MRSALDSIGQKVEKGERIDEQEALILFESGDLGLLGELATLANRRRNGDRALYLINRYINYSNYCILSCRFCSFARKKRDQDGFELSLEEVERKGREAVDSGATELHIVGGLHPTLPFAYYLEMLRRLKALSSRLELKCFTAVEILHLSWLARMKVEETLRELRQAGLGSLTGGGAEIFDPGVRSLIARGKESAEEYLDVHRAWHSLGAKSTCTMLYGHVETLAHRVDHLRQLRRLQDETGGFSGFIPLAYQPEDNAIEVDHPPTGIDSLRTIAVSRIYLDNFDHVTAYWVGLGLGLAQVALDYGADDLQGTIVEEHIFHMAGARTPQQQTRGALERAIAETGRIPVQRDTYYRPVEPAIGSVPYLNARPLVEGIEGNLVTLPPSRLAVALRKREVDVALLSITEAIADPRMGLVDGIGICSDGPVLSVFLAHRGPLEDIEIVHCDPSSLTSVKLLKVLLHRRGVHPSWQPLHPGLPAPEAENVLLIGNPAIAFRQAGHPHQLWDLGAAWKEETGLPFVYAMWMALGRRVPGKLRELLHQARQRGLARLESIAEEHPQFGLDFRRRYLGRAVRYEVGEAQRQGIRRFVRELEVLGEEPVHEPAFLD